MSREAHARSCESRGVRFPPATHPENQLNSHLRSTVSVEGHGPTRPHAETLSCPSKFEEIPYVARTLLLTAAGLC